MNPARLARTRSGRAHRRLSARLLAVSGAVLALVAAAVVVPQALGPAGAATPAGTPFGHSDVFAQHPGGLHFMGWAVDPGSPRSAVSIRIAVDGRTAATTPASLPRADVAKAHSSAGADHGYDKFVLIPEGRHTVCVWATNIGQGANLELSCQQRNLDYGPIGSVEYVTPSLGGLHVKGWAWDADQPTTPLNINVVIDGKTTKLSANRTDSAVTKRYPQAGAAHGFFALIPTSQGTHKVCIGATNVGYGASNLLDCRTVTLDESPRGAVESAGAHSGALRITGWAYDVDKPTTSLSLTVTIDGTAQTVLANRSRSDIAKKYPGAGSLHGFDVSKTLPEGTHSVKVVAHNLSFGSDRTLTSRSVTLRFSPSGTLSALTATSTGATVSGWASDPDTTAPIKVRLTVNGASAGDVTASGKGGAHSGHTFSHALVLRSGKQTVCITALNVLYGTKNSPASCRTVTLALRPLGRFDSVKRSTGSTDLVLTGWALDPDTRGATSVAITVDGKSAGTVGASAARADVAKAYPWAGAAHGIVHTVSAGDGEHTVCVVAVNVGGGSNTSLGCKIINAVHPKAPSAPQHVSAVAGFGGATVSWIKPSSDGGAPWSSYTVTASPGGAHVTAGATATSATVIGLKASTTYSFTVRANNVAGTSGAGTSNAVKTQASPPPQTTPAPVSTSRYIRNIRTASSTEQATLRAEGAADARANPSGHGYLILLDIGGQDQVNGGAVLSATTRFVPYSALVADLRAYVDGYHSAQRASAPVRVALGTNNDMDVSSTSGKAWATQVVNPLGSYARRYPGITIAGANDIEPGFRASYSATRSWLTGYLSATSAPFVFNGSADGCAWTAINRHCNNGWSMAGLYYLAAGASPVRMLNLPQIYNTTMADQWKYISLTGVAQRSPRINFAGTLTEWTACTQTHSCGSISGHSAWSKMWSNLQSDTRLKVGSLPYSTDLRIDK